MKFEEQTWKEYLEECKELKLDEMPPTQYSDEESGLPIYTTNGVKFMVSVLDYPWIIKHNWSCIKTGPKSYIARSEHILGSLKTKIIYLHREILGLSQGDNYQCDHIDGNPMNNIRSNLRIVSQQQNCWNKKKQNKYLGVSKTQHGYVSQIKKNYQTIYLGTFDNAIDAARVRDMAAYFLFDEYARYNFPEIMKNFNVGE